MAAPDGIQKRYALIVHSAQQDPAGQELGRAVQALRRAGPYSIAVASGILSALTRNNSISPISNCPNSV